LNKSGFWIVAARIVWLLALAGLVVRFSCGGSHRPYAFNDYMLAGWHWTHAENLYGNWRGFVYSPVTASFLVPFSCLPPRLSYTLWLVVNAGALLGGLAALFKTNLLARPGKPLGGGITENNLEFGFNQLSRDDCKSSVNPSFGSAMHTGHSAALRTVWLTLCQTVRVQIEGGAECRAEDAEAAQYDESTERKDHSIHD
jgi:hypothetical protein